jgi:hypothetical protein
LLLDLQQLLHGLLEAGGRTSGFSQLAEHATQFTANLGVLRITSLGSQQQTLGELKVAIAAGLPGVP